MQDQQLRCQILARFVVCSAHASALSADVLSFLVSKKQDPYKKAENQNRRKGNEHDGTSTYGKSNLLTKISAKRWVCPRKHNQG